MQALKSQFRKAVKRTRSLLWSTGVYGKLRMYPIQVRGRRFDARNGVNTAGRVDLGALDVKGRSAAHGNHYEAVDPKLFRKILRALKIKYDDFVFVDFGSGMGRAILLAAEFPFRKVIGVEFSARLHAVAEGNIRRHAGRARKCADVESVCIDAVEYTAPEAPAVFFLYNPFKEAVLRSVLANIRESLKQHPREVWLIYVNPELDHLVGGDGVLKKIDCGKTNAVSYTVYKSAGEAKAV